MKDVEAFQKLRDAMIDQVLDQVEAMPPADAMRNLSLAALAVLEVLAHVIATMPTEAVQQYVAASMIEDLPKKIRDVGARLDQTGDMPRRLDS